jgi:hypothetical protein
MKISTSCRKNVWAIYKKEKLPEKIGGHFFSVRSASE